MRKLSCMLFMLSCAVVANADTIHVPGDYAKIYNAIVASNHGDTILVAPGTYEETFILFNGKQVTVKSTDGPAVTRINSKVSFRYNETRDSVLDGFTLAGNGHYVYCKGSSPTIINNVIRDVDFINQGGGIWCEESGSALIKNNIITRILVEDYNATFVQGGGIYIEDTCAPVIRGNLITNNEVAYYGSEPQPDIFLYGGGIYSESSEPLTIVNNVIMENVCVEFGVGIACGPDSVVVGNLLVRNNGFGIYAQPGTQLINNTIYDNRDYGIVCTFSNPDDYIFVTNCIVRENDDQQIWYTTLGNAKVKYSNIEGGYIGPYNIDADPLFVDGTYPDYDLHLTYNSPCRNVGLNGPVTEALDFEGDLRIADNVVDMGADEFYTHFYATGDFEPNGEVEAKFVGAPGTFPVGIFFGSGVLDPPMSHMWGEFYLAPPLFLNPVPVPIPPDGVLIIPATLPASTAPPYDIFLQALIGLHSDSFTNLFILNVR